MIDNLSDSLSFIIQQTQKNAMTLLLILAVLWGVFILSRFVKSLLYFGIIPRRPIGLPGIVFAPFLHAHFNHLFYNSIPLVVLSDFLLVQGLSYFLVVTVIITLLSGLLVWLFAKPGIHLGASGVITGYWGVLICDIYQQGTLVAIVLGLTTVYTFAGIFLGIFPRERGVSWEGHLFGLIAGITASFMMK
jgi:membrane associated rhomboid family serine protease